MWIWFTINEKHYHVNLEDLPAEITLNTYIREYAQLPGTKFMCLEGGCGACIVTITGRHPVTKSYHIWASNSCLTLLSVCDGWHIATVEGLGNKHIGYHPIQERLAHLNGTQCGYCSSGMVMNMYGALTSKGGKLTAQEIENSFGGNLCRCTGYRPILDAMKSFATDSEYEFIDLCTDIEDLFKKCDIKGNSCQRMCRKPKVLSTSVDGKQWCFPATLVELFQIFQQINRKKYTLIGGNTAHGVYRRDPNIEVFIDINYVLELHVNIIAEHQLELGGNITLTEMMDILTQASKQPGFEYCKKLVKHIDLVANVPVRNMGTLAGNLSIKHQHHEFISDIFLILTAVGAIVYVAHDPQNVVPLSLPDFLNYDMDKKVILKVSMPYLDKASYIFKSYKMTPRAQNAHAIVNAAFLLQYSETAIIQARLCFGGIRPNFIEAVSTSTYLTGRVLANDQTIQEAFKILEAELQPDWVLPEFSPEYRSKLACGLFYKFILKICPPNRIKPQYQSGAARLKRPLSSGVQTFETLEDKWPLTKPVTKIEALAQCSGEAMYINDMPQFPGQLWAAFVQATVVKATVASIDASEALRMPGVVAFFSTKDIPGKNTFVTPGLFGIIEEEEIFCKGIVKYHSQPVGVIVAESFDKARFAAKKVQITYEQRDSIEIKPTIKSSDEYLTSFRECEETETVGANSKVTGHFEMGSQYHFTLETLTTVCVPDETGINVYCSTHFIDLVQSAVAGALNINESSVNMEVRRVGGSYGSKLSRCSIVATSCALACMKLNRPVRFVMDIESNMASIGKRFACVCDYSVIVEPSGKISNLSLKFIEDAGCSLNENPIVIFTIPFTTNCYTNNGWSVKGEPALTDAPGHTWCRAPGTLEGIAMIENIMEHIARTVKRDPLDVRMENIPENSKMREILPGFIKSTEYRQRKAEINDFNNNNRWRKRGIAVSLMRYPIEYFGNYPATVAIYHVDGSVAISHGGVEIGQGINTKVLQVAAHTLGIPMEMISIKPTNSVNGANSLATAGSIGSESICYAVRHACLTLLERIKPVRDEMKNASWVEVIQKSHEKLINLIASHMYKRGDLETYAAWGIAVTEVEVDIPTGSFQLNRVDILEDTGESLSPLIDVGQVEGAFVMGLGYWLTERLVYDRQTGELLTNRTWNYKVPGAKDIPVDFRVNLLQKSPNSGGFLRSKTCGELGICLSISSIFALRHAIDSAREQAGLRGWYHLGAPTTPEIVLLSSGHKVSDFTLK